MKYVGEERQDNSAGFDFGDVIQPCWVEEGGVTPTATDCWRNLFFTAPLFKTFSLQYPGTATRFFPTGITGRHTGLNPVQRIQIFSAAGLI